MGRKIEALKWAMRAKINWKGLNLFPQMPPIRHDSTYLSWGGCVIAVMLAGVLVQIHPLGIFAMLIWLPFFRAAMKLESEWRDENYEIKKREPQIEAKSD